MVGDSLTRSFKKRSMDNNSNANRNKSRRDHDITMANAMNNKLPAELKGWYDIGDGLPYHINSLRWNSNCRRNESRSYGNSNRKEAPPSYQRRGAIQSTVYDNR